MSLANASFAVDHSGGHMPADKRLQVQTRFGVYEIDSEKVIFMPKGPYGFAKLHHFALLDLPGVEDGNFKLLQSIDDPSVGFIVLPLSQSGGAMNAEDLTQACQITGNDPETTSFLLLVTIRSSDQGATAMTANLRAPLLLNTETLQACQHIFANVDYPTCQPIAAA